MVGAKGVGRPCVVRWGQLWAMLLDIIGLGSKHCIAMNESEEGIKLGPVTLVLNVRMLECDAKGVSEHCAVVGNNLLLVMATQ